MDVLKHAGVNLLWLDNNSSSSSSNDKLEGELVFKVQISSNEAPQSATDLRKVYPGTFKVDVYQKSKHYLQIWLFIMPMP